MRWARAVEPGNQELARWQDQAQQARDKDEPTLPSSIAQELACNPFMRVRQPTVAQAAATWAQRTLASPVEIFAALREWKNNFR
jgi:hydroxyacylglutathione hydrolase